MEFAQELGKGERALSCPKSLIPSLCFIDTPTSSPLQVAKLHPKSDLLLFLLWPRAVNTRQKAGQHEPITPPSHPRPICGLSRCLGPPATATCYPNSFLPLLGLSMWAPSLGRLLSSGSAAYLGSGLSALCLPSAPVSKSPPRRTVLLPCPAPGLQPLFVWCVYHPANMDGQQAASCPGSIL